MDKIKIKYLFNQINLIKIKFHCLTLKIQIKF